MDWQAVLAVLQIGIGIAILFGSYGGGAVHAVE